MAVDHKKIMYNVLTIKK